MRTTLKVTRFFEYLYYIRMAPQTARLKQVFVDRGERVKMQAGLLAARQQGGAVYGGDRLTENFPSGGVTFVPRSWKLAPTRLSFGKKRLRRFCIL